LLAAAVSAAGACLVWTGAEQRRGVLVGLCAAWLASTVGAGALIVAKERSPQAFWKAWGAGMALRLVVLIALAAYGARGRGSSLAALLLSYALGVLGFLLLEYRHVKLK
jgi:drug/metabolite transporter (DMT)-like permease